MNEDRRLVVATVASLVLIAGALAVGTLLDTSDGSTGGDVPTASGTPYSLSDDGSGAGDEGTAAPPPFEMEIESVESCGQTCRDVTATLVNNQNRRATGVTVYTQIYAGEDTEGDVMWEGTQEVGSLGPGAEETDTKRVELGYMDAMAVQRNDGRITIQLTVETDRRTITFLEHRDVS